MLLSEVRIKNFRGYGEDKVSPDGHFVFDGLDSQLVIFHGFNGHGKTSFFEAIEWCLTDTVVRLEKLYRRGNQGGAYSAPVLKKSHYLKFSPSISNDNGEEEREISVELHFNNGTQIVRKSKSKVLGTIGSNDYSSTVELTERGEPAKVISNSDLLKFMVNSSGDYKGFIGAHILAQDGITDFIRITSPEDRKSVFMRFLQQEGISKHIESLKGYINGGNQLARKKTDLENNRVKYEAQKERINNFLQNIGYSSIDDYKEQFLNTYKNLMPYIKRRNRYEAIPLVMLAADGPIETKRFVNLFQKAELLIEKVNDEIASIQTRDNELKIVKQNIELLNLLFETEQVIQNSSHANFLLESDIGSLQSEYWEYERKRLEFEDKKRDINLKLETTTKYQNLFSSLQKHIDDKNHSVNNMIWDDIYGEFEKLNAFRFDLKNDLERDTSLQLPTKDDEQLEQWKRRLLDLERDSNQVSFELNHLLSKKNSLSTLNLQYQQILQRVKQYIQDQSEPINSCPICHNDNFSVMESLLEIPEDADTNVKLFKIIDYTIANGDQVLLELGNEENELVKRDSYIKNLITDEVIVPLLNWIRLSRQLTETTLEGIRDYLTKQLDNLVEEENKLIVSGQQLKSHWDRVKDSSKVIFGEDVPLQDISINTLNELNNTKEIWLKTNLEKIGFQIHPTTEEVATKIQYIKGLNEVSVFMDKPEELLKEISSTKWNFRFVEALHKRLSIFLKLKIPFEFVDYFEQYENLDNEIKELNGTLEQIIGLQDEVKSKLEQLVQKQNQILGDSLHGHPVISWVYNVINPHSQYKDLKVIVDKQGAHFTSDEIRENLYLDQIFSQAQLNILALSTFLGIGITQKISKLDQLLLDDPIQSMDDVNVLAFIDVLRALLDSEFNTKHLIISTHDDNFAELLAVKMRNKKITQYHIEGYSGEGPVYRALS